MPLRLSRFGVVLGVFFSSGASSSEPATANAVDAERSFIRLAERTSSYEVLMTKQQRIRSRLRDTETIALKHQRTPECRYLKWVRPPFEGREAILCGNRYYGQLQIHDPHMPGFSSLSVDPHSSIARNGNLRPIEQSGMYSLAEALSWDLSEAERTGEISRWQLFARNIERQRVLCRRSEHFHSRELDPYPVGSVEVCYDTQTMLPADVQFWDVGNALMERYTFSDWRLGVPLPTSEFDVKNPAYGF